MHVPDVCPHASTTPRRSLREEPIRLASCCLGGGREILLLLDEEPLCRSVESESEVYRFTWRSSFHGDATVRIGRQQNVVTIRWRRHGGVRGGLRRRITPEFAVASEGWIRLSDALIAADSWSPDPVDEFGLGLDGPRWLIEARRGKVYRGVSRWSPQGELHALGQVFFALAGPPLSRVELY